MTAHLDPHVPSEPLVLRCRSTGEFLAALPHLLGFTPRNSLVGVLFAGSRSRQAFRIDLPPADRPELLGSVLDTFCAALGSLESLDARESRDPFESPGALEPPGPPEVPEPRGARAPGPRADSELSVGIAIITDARFRNGAPPWPRLAAGLRARVPRTGVAVRELCCVAADGWSSSFEPGAAAARRPLAELAQHPLALAAAVRLGAVREQAKLGEIPEPDPERARAVVAALAGVDASRAAEHADPPLGDALWLRRADAHARALTGMGPLSPRRTAALIAELGDHRVWTVVALGILTRPTVSQEAFPGGRTEREFAALPAARDQPGPRGATGWSTHRTLALLSPAFTDRARLLPVRARLTEALSECPEERRAPLLTLSAWCWWLAGLQSVAEHQLAAARALQPGGALIGVLTDLISVPSHILRDWAVPPADAA